MFPLQREEVKHEVAPSAFVSITFGAKVSPRPHEATLPHDLVKQSRADAEPLKVGAALGAKEALVLDGGIFFDLQIGEQEARLLVVIPNAKGMPHPSATPMREHVEPRPSIVAPHAHAHACNSAHHSPSWGDAGAKRSTFAF